jgi:hypothetical protein
MVNVMDLVESVRDRLRIICTRIIDEYRGKRACESSTPDSTCLFAASSVVDSVGGVDGEAGEVVGEAREVVDEAPEVVGDSL